MQGWLSGCLWEVAYRHRTCRREDSFTASNRNAAPLKAEDHRHLFAKPQRSASVPPSQRQMLDEYGESSQGVSLLFFSPACMLDRACPHREVSCAVMPAPFAMSH